MSKYYYVIQFNVGWTSFVSRHDSASLVCDFIDKELRRETTYGVDDFMIIHGNPFNIKEKTVRKVYMEKQL
jgi:hypothetical protein